MIIEILGKCFCGIEIPNAKDPKNEFVQNMKLALWHDPIIQEGWRTLVPSNQIPILSNLKILLGLRVVRTAFDI